MISSVAVITVDVIRRIFFAFFMGYLLLVEYGFIRYKRHVIRRSLAVGPTWSSMRLMAGISLDARLTNDLLAESPDSAEYLSPMSREFRIQIFMGTILSSWVLPLMIIERVPSVFSNDITCGFLPGGRSGDDLARSPFLRFTGDVGKLTHYYIYLNLCKPGFV
jgi:hypothetical protein